MVLCRQSVPGDFSTAHWTPLSEEEARQALQSIFAASVGEQHCWRPQRHAVPHVPMENFHTGQYGRPLSARPIPWASDRVRTHGLARSELNGRHGRCLGWHENSQRFMVQLDGADAPIRVRAHHLLGRMMMEDDEHPVVDSEQEDEPTWCHAAREIVVRWQPATCVRPDRSLQERAAEAVLAAGGSPESLASAGTPSPIVEVVKDAENRGTISVSVPHDSDLWECMQNFFCDGGPGPSIGHVDGEWREEQSRTHGARWVADVSWDHDTLGEVGREPRGLHELAAYYETLRRLSQLLARAPSTYRWNSTGQLPWTERGWRVVADPPLCVLPGADDAVGYHATGRLRMGFPIFFGGRDDVPEEVGEGVLDGSTQLLQHALFGVRIPAALCTGRWRLNADDLTFDLKRQSCAGSSDDETVYDECCSVSGWVAEIAEHVAGEYAAAGRTDVLVRFDFELGDDGGSFGTGCPPPPPQRCFGIAHDKCGEAYMVLDDDDDDEVYDVQHLLQEILGGEGGEEEGDGEEEEDGDDVIDEGL